MTTDLFGKTLSRLTEMVERGVAHIKIGRGLGKMINEDPAIAHVAPAFWGMSMTAHLDAAQLIAFKLFDTRKGTMTVEYLLNRAEELKSVSLAFLRVPHRVSSGWTPLPLVPKSLLWTLKNTV